MSKPNGVFTPFVFLLVFTSVFSPKLEASGSPVHQQNFKRPDPLRGFKNYIGGYNVTDRHYVASAAFTGVHGYVIAAGWLLCGLVLGIFLACKNLSNGSSPLKDLLDHHCFLMFLLIVLVTFLAIVATGLVLAANEGSFRRTKKFEHTVIEAGQETRRSIHKVIIAMTEMQVLLRPYDSDTSMRLYTITHTLAQDSQSIRDFVKKFGHIIGLAIRTSRLVHVVIVSINLGLLVASIVLLLLHWHPVFVSVILVCWILTSVCWVVTGIDFFLNTFSQDTCAEFLDFDRNQQNSSLGSLLPCLNPSYSDQILKELGNKLHNFFTELKTRIRQLKRLLESQGLHVDLSELGSICDPFSGAPNYTYMPENCPKSAFDIGNIPNVIANITCFKENSTETCITGGRFVPQSFYYLARAYSVAVQDLIDVFPEIENLSRCTIVKQKFSDIVHHQCKPFKRSMRFLWSSVLSLSIIMVVLLLMWVAKAYQERGRHFPRWSLHPDQQETRQETVQR